MSTVYDLIEDAIVSALMVKDAPFKQVLKWGGSISDAELVNEIEKLASAQTAPAAVVFYAGGPTNEGFASVLEEVAVFTIVIIVSGRSREAAMRGDAKSAGVYACLDWCRTNLHGKTLSNVPNPLRWQGNRRFGLPGQLLTTAAYAADYHAPLYYADG